MADEKTNGGLADAARTVGATVGKVVSAVGGGGKKEAGAKRPAGSASAPPKTEEPPPENLWKAEYVGSGTFIIHKPKRSDRKRHSQMVRNRRRGMRKF